MHPRPGEVWLADLGLAAKTRPVVIVSRLDPDPPRALIVYVPLTTQNRYSLYEVEIPRLGFLHAISVANVQGIASIPVIRLERQLGTLPAVTMAEIRRRTNVCLGFAKSRKVAR
jgi:mRNA interferase MazF